MLVAALLGLLACHGRAQLLVQEFRAAGCSDGVCRVNGTLLVGVQGEQVEIVLTDVDIDGTLRELASPLRVVARVAGVAHRYTLQLQQSAPNAFELFEESMACAQGCLLFGACSKHDVALCCLDMPGSVRAPGQYCWFRDTSDLHDFFQATARLEWAATVAVTGVAPEFVLTDAASAARGSPQVYAAASVTQTSPPPIDVGHRRLVGPDSGWFAVDNAGDPRFDVPEAVWFAQATCGADSPYPIDVMSALREVSLASALGRDPSEITFESDQGPIVVDARNTELGLSITLEVGGLALASAGG